MYVQGDHIPVGSKVLTVAPSSFTIDKTPTGSGTNVRLDVGGGSRARGQIVQVTAVNTGASTVSISPGFTPRTLSRANLAQRISIRAASLAVWKT
jgi:hypothetical protein